jgi:hypothetical protein
MMRTIPKLFLAVTPWVFPSIAVAAENITCPAEIQQASLKLDAIPIGWTPYVAGPIPLHGASASAGPPEINGQLRPDESTYAEGKKSWRVRYNLQGNFPRGKWIECMYGTMNQVVLSKRLPDPISACVVSYRNRGEAAQHSVEISCR